MHNDRGAWLLLAEEKLEERRRTSIFGTFREFANEIDEGTKVVKGVDHVDGSKVEEDVSEKDVVEVNLQHGSNDNKVDDESGLMGSGEDVVAAKSSSDPPMPTGIELTVFRHTQEGIEEVGAKEKSMGNHQFFGNIGSNDGSMVVAETSSEWSAASPMLVEKESGQKRFKFAYQG